MSKLIRNIIAAALIAGASSLAASDPAPASTPATDPAATTTKAPAAKPAEPAAPPKTTATVVTNEGLSERCILSTVVTAIDGKEVKATDKTDTLEFAPGEHSISGYGGPDPTKCATFTGDNPVVITEGELIGQSTLKFTVVEGKTYYTGVDVRQADKSTWKIVVWQIKH
jgi:hypothetical protein